MVAGGLETGSAIFHEISSPRDALEDLETQVARQARVSIELRREDATSISIPAQLLDQKLSARGTTVESTTCPHTASPLIAIAINALAQSRKKQCAAAPGAGRVR